MLLLTGGQAVQQLRDTRMCNQRVMHSGGCELAGPKHITFWLLCCFPCRQQRAEAAQAELYCALGRCEELQARSTADAAALAASAAALEAAQANHVRECAWLQEQLDAAAAALRDARAAATSERESMLGAAKAQATLARREHDAMVGVGYA